MASSETSALTGPGAEEISDDRAHLHPHFEPSKTFRYSPLSNTAQQIRLVRLRKESACSANIPQCEIEVFELTEAPLFTALSYTWGAPSPTFDIVVNRGKLKVRENLFMFLKAYHSRDYIWIDQICIDQSNVLERNHQVSMMASIYSQCFSVIVWLGTMTTTPNAPIVFYRKKSPEALAVLLQHNYFTRLWIVQEILLAKNIIVLTTHPKIGNVWIPWNAMSQVARDSDDLLRHHNVPVVALALLQEHTARHQGNIKDLFDYLRMFHGGRCQDARDRVYSLMGLVETHNRISVDYERPVHNVFLDIVEVLLYDRGTRSGIKTQDFDGEVVNENFRQPIIDLLMVMGTQMGFTDPQQKSLLGFLQNFWSPSHFLYYQLLMNTHASHVPMGFVPAYNTDPEIPIQPSYSKEFLTNISRKGYSMRQILQCRDYWWFQFGGDTYVFFSPPLMDDQESEEVDLEPLFPDIRWYRKTEIALREGALNGPDDAPPSTPQ